MGSVYYELSHDSLITPIHLSRRKPIDTLFKEAEQFVFDSKIDQAIGKYNQILEEYPKNIMAIVKLGELLSENRKYETAVQLYKKAIANGMTDARVYTGFWKMLFKAGKEEEAITYLDEAIKRSPWQTGTYEALGDHYADKKEFKIAGEYYEKVLMIDNRSKEVYERLAILYVKTGEKEKTLDVFKRAITVDVEFAGIYQEIWVLVLLEKIAGRVKTPLNSSSPDRPFCVSITSRFISK